MLKQFILKNKQGFLLLLLLNGLVTYAIGSVYFPYIDDISRMTTGATTYASSYSRYVSEYLSWFISGSSHLVDTGLTTFLFSALILSITEACLLFVLYGNEKLPFLQTLSSALIGLNPWFLEPLSFRFDSPFMTLSLLVSIFPFLFYQKNQLLYVLSSIVGIFLMCNAYQSSSGIYPMVLLTLVFQEVFKGHAFIGILKKTFLGLFSYGVGIFLFAYEVHLQPTIGNQNTSISSLGSLFPTMIANYQSYFQTILKQSPLLWRLLFGMLLLLFLKKVLGSYKNKFFSLGYALFYLVVGSFLSFGVYAIFSETLADDRPRYIYGFGVWMALLLIQSVTASHFVKKINFSYLVSFLFLFYFVSFSFTYVTALTAQKESFLFYSQLLSSDLSRNFISDEKIRINTFFKDSKVYLNSSQNYPILEDLIISNRTVYWPNTMWFNTLTNMNIDFIQEDTSVLKDSADSKILSDTTYYTLYTQKGTLYIYMK